MYSVFGARKGRDEGAPNNFSLPTRLGNLRRGILHNTDSVLPDSDFVISASTTSTRKVGDEKEFDVSNLLAKGLGEKGVGQKFLVQLKLKARLVFFF